MNRGLAYLFVGVMALMVLGQGIELAASARLPVHEITLHESRLVLFLGEIRPYAPHTHDSTLLNLSRILREGPDSGRYQHEEIVVAEKLLERLTPAAPDG